jgi:ribosomal protein L39E
VIAKVRKEGRRMPVWVTLKTKRRVRRNVKQKNWRTSKKVGKALKRK